jgi:tetratricopeptide (TPR) repeat protein
MQRLGAALALAALLSAAFGVLRFVRPLDGLLPGAPGAQRPAVTRPVPPAPAGRTGRLVEVLQLRLRERPGDQKARAQLGAAYLQRARETGDPGYYAKAEGVLAEALALQPDDHEVMAALGTLALARHQFEAALEWGQRAQAGAPGRAAAYGVVGDALVELGRYDEAVAAFQRMVDLRPDLASYARVSYARELFGDLEGAIEAMQMAVYAGAPGAENTAWAHVQLGHLHLGTGNLSAAQAAYQQALQAYPSYAPATAGLGRVRAAEGKYEEAAALVARAAEALPLPEYVIQLGDVYRAAGRTGAATQQDGLVRAIAQLQRANGVDLDREMALFEADRAGDPAVIAAALQTARARYERRPSIHAADVLAWTLHRAGQSDEALPYAREALRLGTRDPVLLFHAGAIAAAAGQPAEARQHLEAALAQNPQFSLRHAPEARRILEHLNRSGA